MSVKKRLEHLEKLVDEQSSKNNIHEYVVHFISYPKEYYEYEGKRVTFEEYKRLISAQYEMQNRGVIFVVWHAVAAQLDNRKPDYV